jgi:hypothetical protein
MSFAVIVLALTDSQVIEIQQDRGFDEIIGWLALHRANALVDTAFRRLVGAVN